MERSVVLNESELLEYFVPAKGIHLAIVDIGQIETVSSAASIAVVVMGISNVKRMGLPGIRHFLGRVSSARVVVHLDDEEEGDLARFLLAGCSGVVYGETPAPVWESIVRVVSIGEMWVDNSLLAQAFRAALAVLYEPAFSQREEDVLTLLASGLSNPAIARHLFVAQDTVRWHLRNLYAKTGIEGRRALIDFAVQRASKAPALSRVADNTPGDLTAKALRAAV